MRKTCRVFRWRDASGQALYGLVLIMAGLAVGVAAFFLAVHSVEAARATMSQYVQDALQRVADQAVTLDPVNGQQWTKSTDPQAPAAATFAQDLRAAMAGTPWRHLPVRVRAFQIYTPQDVGEPAPWGYPGATIAAPGYYAEVAFPWKPAAWFPAVTITVPEVMQANSLAQPGAGPPQWNPGRS